MSPCDQNVRMRSYLYPPELDNLLSGELRALCAHRHYAERFLNHFEAARDQDFLNQMLYVDCHTFLPDLNLTYSDKLSMASSIESRVPLLDNEVVDFMLRVPQHMKIRRFTQKYLLRKAMDGILPKAVLQRRKAGFGLPVRSWLRHELRDMVHDLLSARRVGDRGLLDPASVTRMVQQNESGERDYTLQIWTLLTLEIWHQTFLDRPLSSSHHLDVPMDSRAIA